MARMQLRTQRLHTRVAQSNAPHTRTTHPNRMPEPRTRVYTAPHAHTCKHPLPLSSFLHVEFINHFSCAVILLYSPSQALVAWACFTPRPSRVLDILAGYHGLAVAVYSVHSRM